MALAEAEAEREFLSSRRLNAVKAIRASRRLLALMLWTLACIPVQAMLLMLPGHGKVAFARWYHRGVCWCLGMEVVVQGTPARPVDGRPVVFASNHSSWLDIPALGSRLSACFIAKAEVGRWPLVRTVARLGRTVFVSRRRADTVGERDAMRARLAAGDSLILFPEGTTSDGGRVLPFRSAFFSVIDGDRPPVVQPVSIVFDRLNDLPLGRRWRPLFAWYGDMDIGSHAWRIAQQHRSRATIMLHAPVDSGDRKALAATAHRVVAAGCAALRQNRPVSAPPLVKPLPAFA